MLKLVLDVGAQPAIKDQEERSALHIAAQYVNWLPLTVLYVMCKLSDYMLHSIWLELLFCYLAR